MTTTTKPRHRLERWCFRHRRTLASVAADMGIDRANLTKWIKGYRPIPATRAEEIEALTNGAVPLTAWMSDYQSPKGEFNV